ncbi:unnamed protein product [Didymodactylos carnosus]|uniref:Tyrosine specific protein phosphatases domain-containing protein n=1 Tax=Didymodactylos carnosus TaxID=1234261 RepID=A0A814P1D2_9BILA|nr:unnamed protein product [Didymodactylos carnosus]CAF1229947.1 unnamed protein product [Didymodactylos carnosus]CAF3862793.1 unnamed protein product [Didymodactylos carnosus]CAF4037911.1 unnamed protein product [Didymodactylos carnosus]
MTTSTTLLTSSWPPVRVPVTAEAVRGISDWSHWVIKPSDTASHGGLIAGAYPGHKDPAQHKLLIRHLIQTVGVSVFVNLIETDQLPRFTPYIDLAKEAAVSTTTKTTSKEDIHFIPFPIVDSRVHTDPAQVLKICLDIIELVKQGKIIYVHCWGGHGRTGTLISIILGIVYDLDGDQALELNGKLHDLRKITNGIPSPETDVQLKQVREVLNKYHAENKKQKI